jgi:hypothetical protein
MDSFAGTPFPFNGVRLKAIRSGTEGCFTPKN